MKLVFTTWSNDTDVPECVVALDYEKEAMMVPILRARVVLQTDGLYRARVRHFEHPCETVAEGVFSYPLDVAKERAAELVRGLSLGEIFG